MTVLYREMAVQFSSQHRHTVVICMCFFRVIDSFSKNMLSPCGAALY